MGRGLLSEDDELTTLSSLGAQLCVCVSRIQVFSRDASRATSGNDSVSDMAKCASAVSVQTCRGGEEMV